jgi:hypothetical protein
MSLAGAGLETTNNTDAFFHVTSLPGNTDIEIGIFDGDGLGGANGSWDINSAATIDAEYTLFLTQTEMV